MTTPETLRVAFYCNLIGWPKASSGGVRQWVLALANGLVQRGIAVDLLSEAPPHRFVDEPRLDARVGRVVLGPRGWRAARALERYARLHPDVRLVSALNGFNLRAVRLKRRCGDALHLTLTQHEHLTGDAAWRRPWLQWLLAHAVRRHFNHADAVVGVSADVVHDLHANYRVDADRLHVIHNPAFTRAWIVASREQVAHPWFEDRSIPTFIAVGRLHPVKGFDVLLDAFKLLTSHRPARLIILGEGRMRAELQAQVERLRLNASVILQGRVDNVAAWMARADVFVSASRSEAFGNALVEALALGLPVVATRCPGGPADILEEGRWGDLVPVDDARALSDSMARAVTPPPRERTALQQRAGDFSLDKALDGYLRVWLRPIRPRRT